MEFEYFNLELIKKYNSENGHTEFTLQLIENLGKNSTCCNLQQFLTKLRSPG